MDRVSDKLRWQAIHHADAIKDVKCKEKAMGERIVEELYTILVANSKGKRMLVDQLVQESIDRIGDELGVL